ncbi:DUF2563 family protein [Mycobacterium sp. 050134]|uniref:DUF2563 family protein n=1 Tax=Mycobacterium sp. 050134 TaxID=3096111 RepID=UPI002ED7E724
MFVDTSMLRTGGNDSRRAGDYAQQGADELSRGPVSSGMFGEFAAAQEFHAAVSAAHTRHVANLKAHQQTLTDVGGKAHQVAAGFTEMDNNNATEMRMVRDGSATRLSTGPSAP